MTVLFVLVAPAAGRISDRIGSRWLIGTGMALLAGSLLLFGQLDARSSFWTVLPALLVCGVGMAITMSPTTAAAMSAVPIDKAGVGSAVISSMRQVGGSLGIAVMGALVATEVAVTPADPSFAAQYVAGYQRALHVGAAILLAGAVTAVLTVRSERRRQPMAGP